MNSETQARVVDASVVVSFAFGEDSGGEAGEILESSDLYAPYLLLFEVTNIARSKALVQPDGLAEIFEGLDIALSLDVNWVEVDFNEIFLLALGRNLSAYDASYLYTSRTLGIPLVTFDERLHRAQETDGM